MPPRREGAARLRAGALIAVAIAGAAATVLMVRRPGPVTMPLPSGNGRAAVQEVDGAASSAGEAPRVPAAAPAGGLYRTEVAVEEPEEALDPSRLPHDLGAAVGRMWHEAALVLPEAGVDLPGDLQAVTPPAITAANAAALIRDHRAFRERLLAAYTPFAELAREKVRLLLEYGVIAPSDERALEPARDPATIWIASRSDGSQRVVLQRGMYADLDLAYAAFAPIWRSRTAHYERMLRYFVASR